MSKTTVGRGSVQSKRPGGLCSSIEGGSPAERAIDVALMYGSIDGAHHKAWVIDQMVRALLETGEAYAAWCLEKRDGADGPETYDEWDSGIAP